MKKGKRFIAAGIAACILLGGCGTKEVTMPSDEVVSGMERIGETETPAAGEEAEDTARQAVPEENQKLADTLAARILDEDWQYVYDHLVQADNAFIEPADIQYYFMSQLTADNGKSGKVSMRDQGYTLAQTYMAVNAGNFGGNEFDGKEVILNIKNDTADFFVGLLPDKTAADGFVCYLSSADFWNYDAGENAEGYHGDFLIVPEAVTDVKIRGKAVCEDWRDDSIFCRAENAKCSDRQAAEAESADQEAAESESIDRQPAEAGNDDNTVMGTGDTDGKNALHYKAYRVILPVTSLQYDRELADEMMENYGVSLGEPENLEVTGTTAYGSCTSSAPEYEFLNDAERTPDFSVSAGGYTTDFALDDNAQINEAMGTKLADSLTQILNTYHMEGTSDPDAFRPYFADDLTENADNWAAVLSYIDELGSADGFFNIAPDTAVRNIFCTGAAFTGDVHIEKGRWKGQITTTVQSDPSQYGQYYTEQDLEMRVGTNATKDMAIVFNNGDPLISRVSRSFFAYMM